MTEPVVSNILFNQKGLNMFSSPNVLDQQQKYTSIQMVEKKNAPTT